MENEMTLRQKKEVLVKEWEDCFGKKIEDAFTDKGISKFWNGNTSYKKAEAMLTRAALNVTLDGFLDKLLFGVVIEEEEVPNEIRILKSYRPRSAYSFVDTVFESKEEAKEWIDKEVKTTTAVLSDFTIVKVL